MKRRKSRTKQRKRLQRMHYKNPKTKRSLSITRRSRLKLSLKQRENGLIKI